MRQRLPLPTHWLAALSGDLGEQWDRDRRETLFVTSAILLTVIPHLAFLSWWTTIGFLAMFAWRLGLLITGRSLPGALIRWLGTLACAAAVYTSHGTLMGREAGVAMLVLLLGLKLLEVRARRDLFVVIFLCFFLLLTTFLDSQSMTTAVLVVAAVCALVASMLTIQYRGREPRLAAKLGTAGLLIAQAIPVTILLFVLFPRIQGPLWGMPTDTRTAGTGLSDTMSPGDISNLVQSGEIVFRASFDGPAPPASRLYWRGPVLGAFDGRQWSAQHRKIVPPPALALVNVQGPGLTYAVTLEPSRRRWLFALEAPIRLQDLPAGDYRQTDDMTLLARRPVTQRVRYRAESVLEFRFGLNESPLSLRNWVELPGGYNPRTLELAGRWRAQDLAPERLVEQALAMFASAPFRYTLSPPLLGRNSVDEFLFDTRAGFCEHYAGAFVVLMRALDIPARVVTGYQGGEFNQVDGYWAIRQSDAHAWAEVWLSGRGWVRVDPTAAVAPERIERGANLFSDMRGLGAFEVTLPILRNLRMNLDALVNAWNQWVLGYDERNQLALLSRLGFGPVNWKLLAALLGIGLALALGTLAWISTRSQRTRDPLQRGFQEFCDRLARAGIVRRPDETARQLLERAASKLPAEELRAAREIVDRYNALRYGDAQPSDSGSVRHLRTLIRAFKP